MFHVEHYANMRHGGYWADAIWGSLGPLLLALPSRPHLQVQFTTHPGLLKPPETLALYAPYPPITIAPWRVLLGLDSLRSCGILCMSVNNKHHKRKNENQN